MKPILRSLFTCVVLVSMQCCVEYVKYPGRDVTFAEVSVGSWRSNLAPEKREIGMAIWNQPKHKRVDTRFVNYVVEFAKLNGVPLQALSVDVAQLEDGSGDAYLQPAEIVFDGQGMTETGWNALSFSFLKETAWDYFKDKTAGTAFFRLDSAPVVARIVFNPDQSRIGVEFSEVVDGNTEPSPVKVEGPEGPLDCTFTWGVPKDRASVACTNPLPSVMTISVKELGVNGNAVTAVDGSPFSLTVNPSEQPVQLDGLTAWTPAAN